jgi:hypothetical protein
MTKPMIKIHNIATDEVELREMNDAEYAQWEANNTEAAQRQAQAEAKATEKAALLDRLGITEDEAKLLLA